MMNRFIIENIIIESKIKLIVLDIEKKASEFF